jgi:hypothetical protein
MQFILKKFCREPSAARSARTSEGVGINVVKLVICARFSISMVFMTYLFQRGFLCAFKQGAQSAACSTVAVPSSSNYLLKKTTRHDGFFVRVVSGLQV